MNFCESLVDLAEIHNKIKIMKVGTDLGVFSDHSNGPLDHSNGSLDHSIVH